MRKAVRHQIIELIMETDMQFHFTFIEQFNIRLNGGDDGENVFDFEDSKDRL